MIFIIDGHSWYLCAACIVADGKRESSRNVILMYYGCSIRALSTSTSLDFTCLTGEVVHSTTLVLTKVGV
jgi:hypothetical protein